MKARALIGGASFDPETLKKLFLAFDAAWTELSSEVTSRADAIEAARMKLAEYVIMLATNGTRDPDKLAQAAVAMMRAKPLPLRSKAKP